MIDMLGELGIVFFLFEMGLELSIARLNAMKKDVFGLGTSQFLVTSAVGLLSFIGHLFLIIIDIFL
jgi:Kef-type K+ transport system membrane component KefB